MRTYTNTNFKRTGRCSQTTLTSSRTDEIRASSSETQPQMVSLAPKSTDQEQQQKVPSAPETSPDKGNSKQGQQGGAEFIPEEPTNKKIPVETKAPTADEPKVDEIKDSSIEEHILVEKKFDEVRLGSSTSSDDQESKENGAGSPQKGKSGGLEPEQFRKLFIGGLSLNTTDESLHAYYSQYGTLVDCIVARDPKTNRSRGFGFVSFQCQEEFDRALASRPHDIDGKVVDSKIDVPRDKRLFLSGVREEHNEEQFHRYFSEFGSVTEVQIIQDEITNKNRGFAFINFDDYDPVDRCVLLKSHMIGGYRCDVEKALSKEGDKKARKRRRDTKELERRMRSWGGPGMQPCGGGDQSCSYGQTPGYGPYGGAGYGPPPSAWGPPAGRPQSGGYGGFGSYGQPPASWRGSQPAAGGGPVPAEVAVVVRGQRGQAKVWGQQPAAGGWGAAPAAAAAAAAPTPGVGAGYADVKPQDAHAQHRQTILKARYGKEIRKELINNYMSLGDLVAKMQRYFDIKDPANIKLKYCDEEKEWITLADDDDLAFALSTMELLYVEVIGVADEDEGEGVITASSYGQEEKSFKEKEQKIHREVQPKQSDEKDLSPPTPMSSVGAGFPTGMPPPPISSTPAQQQQPEFFGVPPAPPVSAMGGLPTAPTPSSGIGELTEIPLNGLGMPPLASKSLAPTMDNQQQWKGSSVQNGPVTGMSPPPISSAPALPSYQGPATISSAPAQQQHQPAFYGVGEMPPAAPVSTVDFIGLKSQGGYTCFVNVILQTFFHTNKLRKAIFQMPTEEDNLERSLAVAMQRMFYEMHCSKVPVETKKLTNSFDKKVFRNLLQQHDAHEFCSTLRNSLESKMRNTNVADTIPSLFKGRMKSYIKCKQVDFESSHEECFYDLQLDVKGNTNVLESFNDYIRKEFLDGENKYDAEEYGLQVAEKGVEFISFPPVLHLQLMRFHYDPLSDTNVKINDYFGFTEELDLNPFCESGQRSDDDNVFLLHAVLVHSGCSESGHYVVFIKVGADLEWYRFDDTIVAKVSPEEAVSANFGGEKSNQHALPGTNAYLLIYVKKSAIADVLCPVSPEDIPEHLKCRLENEKRAEHE